MLRSALAALLLATLLGRDASAGDEDDYMGSIELVGFPYCAEHSLPAWGQLLSIDDRAALYSLFGNRFGGDAAQKTFALPDLRDQAPKGMMYCVVIEGPFPTQ
jgi:microcystin-dependent protein